MNRQMNKYIDRFYEETDIFLKRLGSLNSMKVLNFDDKIQNEDISKIILKNIIH